MPEVLGFDVYIEVEGRRLPEYKPEVSVDPATGVPVTTCWVPSEAGKEFCVAVAPPPAPRQTHWSFSMALDGKTPQVRACALLKKAVVEVRRLAEELVSSSTTRPFQFATIELTDEDSALHTNSTDLGQIELTLRTVAEYIESVSAPTLSKTDAAGPVHEKAKKALAHRIGFGEERKAEGSFRWLMPVGQVPRAKVIFKYRNIDILIADDIAPGRRPRAESPQPTRRTKPSRSTSNRSPPANAAAGPSNSRKRKAKEPAVKIEINLGEVDRMDNEEKELEARLAALRSKKAKIQNATRVKMEVKPEFAPSFLPGEVIDLTED